MEYIKEPLYVSIVNPLDNNNIRVHYFLGNIPNYVLQAAQSGIFNEQEKIMEWKRDAKVILKDFYGPNWLQKLTGEEPVEMKSFFNIYSNTVVGGDDFGDLSFFDQDIVDKIIPTTFIDNSELTSKIIYSNVSVYPEDTIYDLRHKIQLLTKIPIYRQFLFYYVNGQGPYYTYQIFINKVPYIIKWNNMLYQSKLNVGGIGIDSYFEQNKNEIDIISYDLTRLLENKTGHRINKVYIIDLNNVIEGRNIVLNDKYQFDLLYYGFIVKYWPQLTPDAFRMAMNNPDKISETYPKLFNDFTLLYNFQQNQQQLINKTYKFIDKINYSISITHSNLIVLPDIVKMNVNIRNIFDLLELNNDIYAMYINFKYGLRTYFYYSKKHISVMNKEIIINNDKNILSICIKGLTQIVINISRSGSYELSIFWPEELQITFDNILDNLTKYVNPVIYKINSFGSLIFPMGGKLKLLDSIKFNNISLLMYYPFTFTTAEFINLKNSFKQYELLNIIRSQNIQISRSFAFTFIKGIVETNFVYDSYKWLYDNVEPYGRTVVITHRTDRIQIELFNIKNNMEYDTIKRYLLTILDSFVNESNIKKEKKIDKIKPIKKLHDLDPELFNLHKYSNKVQAYSVLCQSTRQPTIYDENMVKNMPNKNIITYWNFTHNKPAYYLCNNKYPYMNFITNKHPKGYCLPCCKKLKDTPGTKVAEINQECFKNKIYTEENAASSYILNYGKINIDRISNIPIELENTIFESKTNKRFYIYGVKQFYNDTNFGFIYSIKYIFGEHCIEEISELVKEMKYYYTLGNGIANTYKSANDLYMDLISNFVSNKNALILNINMSKWQSILIDLIRYKYNTELILINNDTNFYIKCSQEAIKNINNGIKTAFIINDKNGMNPIIFLDSKNLADKESIFESNLIKLYMNIYKNSEIDLDFMISFCHKHNYKINELYINLRNMCYGINIDDSIYLPTIESIIPQNNTFNLNYDIRKQPTVNRRDILKIINQIGTKVMYNIKYNDTIIGVMTDNRLCYFHKQTSEDTDNILNFHYDPIDIDKSIIQRTNVNTLSDAALRKKYYNNLYKLFFSEFTSILYKNNNVNLRKKIEKVILETNFTSSKSIQALIQNLDIILKNYPTDLITIRNFIEYIYFNSIELKEIINFIKYTKFEFDFTVLHELRLLSDNDLLKKLHSLLDESIIIGEVNNIPQNYNIYTSCTNKNDQFFCKDSKILIPRHKNKDLFDALLNDIRNISKIYSFMMGNSGIFNYLEFIERPTEFIEFSNIKNELQ